MSRIAELAQRFHIPGSLAELEALADTEAADFRERMAALGCHITLAQARAALDLQKTTEVEHGNEQ